MYTILYMMNKRMNEQRVQICEIVHWLIAITSTSYSYSYSLLVGSRHQNVYQLFLLKFNTSHTCSFIYK